ncbi:hypothetical protein [Caldimonas brevitalea]|uniref:Uncharacterized protein n=1 Tax=Caldimonas brevitalea TaxID=413882 RepID=A0A0G3BKQ2_9BURK|nr:hypothetical protein [Caldimonas brevitalea]AKJ27120.1 hypothetical protein AAW51_0429 [Caldimonas brevitalea]
MLEVFVLVVVSVAAVRSAIVLRKSRLLFIEFKCPQVVASLVLLFPLGPLVMLIVSWLIGLLPAATLAVMCFIPGLVAIRRARRVFDRSGTDRTRSVQDALAVASITGIGGIAYIVCSVIITLAFFHIRAA